MAHLPVIVGFGGVNSAGRTSFHHSYRRMTIDRLAASDTTDTMAGLATMMGLLRYENGRFLDSEGTVCPIEKVSDRFGKTILEHTLLRRIEPEHFDVNHAPVNKQMYANSQGDAPIRLQTAKRSAEPYSRQLEGNSRHPGRGTGQY